MMHYVKSGYKRRRGQLEHLAQKRKRNCFLYLSKLPVKQRETERERERERETERERECVCVCHHATPIFMVSKQCSYTFTPVFSFMACTGTALASSEI